MKLKTIIITCILVYLFSSLPASASEISYQFHCIDENGVPIADVAIQLCSETDCMMQKSDEQGFIVFDREPGEYQIHILKIPEMFIYSGDIEFTVTSDGCDETLSFLSAEQDPLRSWKELWQKIKELLVR